MLAPPMPALSFPVTLPVRVRPCGKANKDNKISNKVSPPTLGDRFIFSISNCLQLKLMYKEKCFIGLVFRQYHFPRYTWCGLSTPCAGNRTQGHMVEKIY